MKHHAALVLGLAIVLAASLAFAQAAPQPGQAARPPAAAPSAPGAAPAAPGAPPVAAPSAPATPAAPSAASAAPAGRITAEELNRNLQQAGITGERAHQIKYVMLARVEPFDPAHVLAIKDDLKLTDDQVQKLQSMIQKSQQDTKGVLTDDQQRIISQFSAMTVADATAQLPPSVSNMLMAQARGRAPAGTPGATSPGMPPSSPGARQ